MWKSLNVSKLPEVWRWFAQGHAVSVKSGAHLALVTWCFRWCFCRQVFPSCVLLCCLFSLQILVIHLDKVPRNFPHAVCKQWSTAWMWIHNIAWCWVSSCHQEMISPSSCIALTCLVWLNIQQAIFLVPFTRPSFILHCSHAGWLDSPWPCHGLLCHFAMFPVCSSL